MSNKLYLIGNAHLDPVWLWRWQEGFSEILATFRSALDRMNDFPEFKFTSACALYYEFVEKMDPAMFEEIKKRVAEGRWAIVGGMFLQPDCNIPDGESFARHFLISQRYFDEKFGVMATTGYNVDSFGHNGGMPKILNACGIENYVFMRPSPEEQGRGESLFIWESDDGSRVRAFRIPWLYNSDFERMDYIKRVREKTLDEKTDLMGFYGIGNHGGGPTIKMIDEINAQGWDNALYSTPDEYFANVTKENLPVINGDLQHHARGCYSAESSVKRANRRCEQNLLAAEKLCVMAKELTGYKYPAKKLEKAWKNLMFNQFHDIIGGCSIKKAYDDANHLFGETMSITEQEMYFAMQSIARRIDTLQGETLPSYKSQPNWKMWVHEVLGTPIVVFNPHTWAVKSQVFVNVDATRVTDCNGREVAFQMVRGDQTNGEDKYHTSFVAEVPAMGYAVYRVFVEKASEERFANEFTVSERVLENSKIRVEFDGVTGDVCKFVDKCSGREIINSPCAAVLLDETECDTWAHNKTALGETVGAFGEPQFKVLECGPVRATIRVTAKYGNSTLQRDYSILAGDDNVTVGVKVDFHEKHKTLKFAFPMTDETVISKIAYGTIKKQGYSGEEPMGSWFASGNLAVANDSKYGYDTENAMMRMTVLRGAIYADHYGVRDDLCEFMEQGIHEFTYSLFPYNTNSDAERRSEELNFTPRYIMDSFHVGTLPESFSGFEGDADNTIVSCIKEKYDGDGTVVRLYEMDGQKTEENISVFGKKITKSVKPYGLVTFDTSGNDLNLIEM